MGRAPCCEKVGLKRGRWTAEEDEILANYIAEHGEGSWRSMPKNAGLLRCGKSCRLRWINYLRAGVKRGNISKEEDDVIVKLHATLGNRWSLIASHLPGRTDNEIKNYWNSHLSRQIHTFRRKYTAGPDTTVTFNVDKLSAAGKRRGGRISGQPPKSSSKKQPEPEPEPEPEHPAKEKHASSPAASATSSASASASSPPQSDEARSTVVDPDRSQPNHTSSSVNHSTSDGPCSEDATWPTVLDPVEQIGLWEADSMMGQIGLWEAGSDMEALLLDNVGLDFLTARDTVDQVDDLLDMDWEGFAAHLWEETAPRDLPQAGEPQGPMDCTSDELDSFASWLLSDSCEDAADRSNSLKKLD